MQLKYEKVECFKACGIFFTKVSEWNGFEEWRDPQGRKLIAAREGGFVEAFCAMLAVPLGQEVQVIRADKGLLADIEAAQAKEKTQ